jgi:acyl-CoA synthetase (AMP-forming)/AMP-acid ligase II
LLATGLRAGDRVAIVSRNAPAYIEALFAIWWAGLIAVLSMQSCIRASSGSFWRTAARIWP